MNHSSLAPSMVATCIFLTLLSSTSAMAQHVEPGTIEAGFGGGFSGGLPSVDGDILDGIQQQDPSATLTDVSETEWNVGGSIGAGVADNTLVRFDVVRTRIFSGTVNSGGESLDIDASLTEFTGGVEYLIETDRSVVPFVSGSVGVGRLTIGASGEVFGTSVNVDVSDNETIYNLGGGVRAYFTDPVSFRPDFRWVRLSGENFWRATFGVALALN